MPRRPVRSSGFRDGKSSALPADHHAAGSRWQRQWALLLPSDPFLAIGTTLFFPDRNGLLEAIDDHPARLERFATMRRGAGDDNRCLTDVQKTQTVGDGGGNLRKTCMNIINDSLDLFFCHWAIGIVENRFHPFFLLMIPNHSFEDHARAVR